MVNFIWGAQGARLLNVGRGPRGPLRTAPARRITSNFVVFVWALVGDETAKNMDAFGPLPWAGDMADP